MHSIVAETIYLSVLPIIKIKIEARKTEFKAMFSGKIFPGILS
jgi:hypothetical protein